MKRRRKDITLRLAMVAIAWMSGLSCCEAAAGHAARRGPNFLHFEKGSGKLLVLCEKSGSILRLDPGTGKIEAETYLGEQPFALATPPGGRRLFVSCRRGQEVVEIDRQSLEVLRRFPLLGDPTGLAVSGDGGRLYVGLHSLDRVAVLDLKSGNEIKRLTAGNGPEMVRLSPAIGRVYVTNLMSNPVPPDQPPQNEITVIDDRSTRVVERIIMPNANVGRHIDFSADGSLAVVAISRPKNLIPMVQVARSWVVSNGFAVFKPGDDTPPVQLLIDQPNRASADPYAVAVADDGKRFYMTAAGSDQVLALDLAKVREVAAEALDGKIPRYADHLGLSRRYVAARIRVGTNPQALALNAGRLFVANRLDDSISVIDPRSDQVVDTLVLGRPGEENMLLQGERLFHSAARTFQQQFACVSCHPDGGLDGLRYDLEPDGIGEDLLDNRSMRDLKHTAPFKWTGTNPDISTQCGSRTAKWIVRTGWLKNREVVALTEYIHSIQQTVNPYVPPEGEMTPAQRRGKAFFQRTTTNDGKPIPQRDQCHFCHSGPQFTNHQRFDVGTRGPTDTKTEFDTAHLINIYESPPFLHDGRAATLEEIWTKYNAEDKHGISNDWTKQQLNDLVEYLKCIGAPQETMQ